MPAPMGLPDPGAPRFSVPASPDAFFGRERLLEDLASALERGERLLTLVGPGGIGKTRAALELCRRLEGTVEAADGVWFCDLSDARDATQASDAVARTLGLDTPDRDLGPALAGCGRVLLVLDDLERVVAELAPLVQRWLDDAPELRVLSTSRERLRLRDELVFEVAPLEVPQLDDPAALLSSDAVRLFLARAGRRRALDAEAVAVTLGAIVRHLEGIPLAIELAAGRVGSLAPTQILAEVARGLDGLGTGDRSRPDRKATLRRTLEGSFELLEPDERWALARLSLFAGGFDADAARAVLGDHPSALAWLESLHDKSLVRVLHEPRLFGVRYSLFESVRAFADEQLSPDEREAATVAHARHYADLADALTRTLAARHDPRAAASLAVERENFARVLDRPGDRGRAARAGLALESVLTTTGRYEAARVVADQIVDAARASAEPALEVRALVLRAEVLRRRNTSEAEADLLAALALDARGLEGRVCRSLGVVARDLGKFDEARAHLVRASARVDPLGAPREAAAVELAWASLERRTGRSEAALTHAERALATARAAGDGLLEGRALLLVGLVLDDQGGLEPALDRIEQAVTLLRAHGDRWMEEVGLNALGLLHFELGRPDEARAAFEEARTICEDSGFFAGLACVNGNLGWLEIAAHRLDRAVAQFDQAVTQAHAVGFSFGEAQFSASLGAAEALRQRVDAAEAAFERAERVAATCPSPTLRLSIDTLRGLLDLAHRCTAAAEQRLAAAERAPRLDGDGRLAVRVLRRALDTSPSTPPDEVRLLLDAEARQLLFGPVSISLARHPSLWRMVEALVSARGGAAALDVDALFAAGWPGERIGRRAARNRVHVGLSTLRKLGLSGVLVNDDDGYRIAAHVAITAP
ncbi:MAG: tetratricopeptide repeat protein [Myxococcales bacterium]|nr:tetratricopeptide repeat protein [Myxococcales bacterium]